MVTFETVYEEVDVPVSNILYELFATKLKISYGYFRTAAELKVPLKSIKLEVIDEAVV